jgi:hypothetical protein
VPFFHTKTKKESLERNLRNQNCIKKSLSLWLFAMNNESLWTQKFPVTDEMEWSEMKSILLIWNESSFWFAKSGLEPIWKWSSLTLKHAIQIFCKPCLMFDLIKEVSLYRIFSILYIHTHFLYFNSCSHTAVVENKFVLWHHSLYRASMVSFLISS